MAVDIQPPMPPVFIDEGTAKDVRDAIWWSIGRVPTPRIYVSIQGDWWDMIAIRCYGRKRGNEHLMHRLIEANYPLRDLCNFPAGVAVIVPEIEVGSQIQLVPWKRASRLPSA